MKNPKTIAIALGALVLLGVGFFFVRGPKPHIEIKAETLFEIGPFPVVNTWVTSLLVLVVIITITTLATRNLTLIPKGLQNAVEAVAEALYNICINTAGEKNGRRFFPVIATIFVFIWIANWMALLPFFNAIGSVEKVDPDHFLHEAIIFESAGPLNLIRLNQSEVEFHEDEEALAECETIEGDGALREDCIRHVREEAILHTLEEEEGIHAESYEAAIAELEDSGKSIGVIFPWFRSMNTDINSPLSIAIMAMIFVEFWGITALGIFKYGGKFFNFSSPIYFFVGLLELVAEFARVISFTFRLFGNMLAGEILLLVMTFLAPFLVALPFYGLETFVGVIQAFVFAMLTLVFATLAVQSHDDHGEDHGDTHADEGVHYQGPDVPLQGPVPAE